MDIEEKTAGTVQNRFTVFSVPTVASAYAGIGLSSCISPKRMFRECWNASTTFWTNHRLRSAWVQANFALAAQRMTFYYLACQGRVVLRLSNEDAVGLQSTLASFRVGLEPHREV